MKGFRLGDLLDDERVQLMVSLAGSLWYEAELDSGTVRWTGSLLRKWGYDLAAVPQSAVWWLERTHPDDRATVTTFLAEALDGRHNSWHLAYRFQRADGTYAHVVGHAALLRGPTGVPYATSGIVHDVTAEVEATQAMAAREQDFRRLAESAREMICQHTPTGDYTYVSPAAIEITGWQPAELLGRNPYELFHPDDAARILRESHELALTGRLASTGITYRFRRKDGGWVWLETTTRPLVSDLGAVISLHTSSRDVTERRALEERLRVAEKMEAIGQLAGGVAHDFNNLLTVIRGNLELLRNQADTSEAQELVLDAHDAADRAGALIQQLLAFGRKQFVVRSSVDVGATLEAMRRMCSMLLGHRGSLVLDAAPGVWAMADRGLMEQAVLNLVANARDAQEEPGPVTIRARRTRLDAPLEHAHGVVGPGEWSVLEVEDTGVGMTPATIARAVEPYFTTKALGTGTGLGLASVTGILAQLGGHLVLQSVPGAGTIAQCWLPASESKAPSPTSNAEPDARLAPSATVMVVDDEPGIRAVAGRMLQRVGLQVMTAEDGQDALEQLEDRQVDLVLTDVVMPRLGGRELAERLQGRGYERRIIFMSGFSSDELLTKGLLQQGVPLVRKPFECNELTDAVRDALAAPVLLHR